MSKIVLHWNNKNLINTIMLSVADFRDLLLWWIEAHVVDSTTGRMNPAVAQSLPQGLIGDVEADNQVQLKQIIQGLCLRQGPGKAYKEQREKWSGRLC